MCTVEIIFGVQCRPETAGSPNMKNEAVISCFLPLTNDEVLQHFTDTIVRCRRIPEPMKEWNALPARTYFYSSALIIKRTAQGLLIYEVPHILNDLP